MNINMSEVLSVVLGLVFGLLGVMIALGFVPGIFTATSTVLNTPDIGDYTGATQTVQAFPTFITLGVLVVSLGIIFGPASLVAYNVYKKSRGGGKKGK
jgi:hypothetical protein